MKIRLEIDVDEDSIDEEIDELKSPFEIRNEIAEVRREMLITLVDSGRWTVERGQSGIYFLERGKKETEGASIGFGSNE